MVENNEEKKEMMGFNSCTDDLKMALDGKESLLNQGLINLSITTKGEYVKITVVPPEGKKRIAHDIICVMDISGSMAEEAMVRNKSGVKEGDGLSYLDLLKHAAKTIILNLSEEDRFALISYSDDARVEFDLDYMTDEAKAMSIKALEKLRPENSTNIWGGIFEALEMAKKYNNKKQHQSILLLTDGEPNVFPPAGMIPQLEKYKKMNNSQIAQINSFAIGKHINTPLLDSYAQIGQGQYCFIPCPGFIGTIFVNTISNILSTMANECQLKIEFLNGVKLDNVPGGYPIDKNVIFVGDIKFGQRRDIVLKLHLPPNFVKPKDQLPIMNVQCKYFDFITGKYQIGEVKEQKILDFEDPLVDAEISRVNFLDYILKVLEVMKAAGKGDKEKALVEAKRIVERLDNILKITLDQLSSRSLKEWDGKPNEKFFQVRYDQAIEFIKNISKDVEGEVKMAVSKIESFEHWGQHFLPSLCDCHRLQLCNNFCDPGIQNYGGALFREIKDKAELTFIKLPAPKPSKPKKKERKASKQAINYPVKSQNINPIVNKQPEPEVDDVAAIDMNNYYNAGGGCFDGNCYVKMADGTTKQVKLIKKGDKIRSEGVNSTIIAVVEIQCVNKRIPMVQLKGGLLITPKHPVKFNGKWCKPKDIGEIKEKQCPIVYNFVLDHGHCIEINNICCVTLGHHFKGEKVQHPYFGSDQVIEDLKRSGMFIQGVIQLKMNQFVRNEFSKQICGIIY